MADLTWNPIQNNANNSAYVQSIEQAQDIINSGLQHITAEDWFNGGFADKFSEQQSDIWGGMREQETNKYQPNSNINDISSSGSETKYSAYSGQKEQLDHSGIMYNQFRKRGLDHNQALGLIMNVQAENNFIPKYLFGTHQDGDKTAYGALSWQGGREVALLEKLSSEGLYDANTKTITPNQRALEIQADYMIDELQSGKQGNYLNYVGTNPFDYARYANKTFTRSSRKESVLQGRERSYLRALQSKDWSKFLKENQKQFDNPLLNAINNSGYITYK